jgi:predicted DsbA family dithiol-disulfide isomerase
MKSLILATLLISALSAVAVPAAGLPAGFQQVPEPATVPNPARVEVIDFFWYGCPYCNLFEPQLQDWLANKPDNVDFIRIPAVIRFEAVFNSEETSRKVQQAVILTRRYGIDSVPALVVNGRYRTNPVLAGGASRMLDAVNGLVESEQTKAP